MCLLRKKCLCLMFLEISKKLGKNSISIYLLVSIECTIKRLQNEYVSHLLLLASAWKCYLMWNKLSCIHCTVVFCDIYQALVFTLWTLFCVHTVNPVLWSQFFYSIQFISQQIQINVNTRHKEVADKDYWKVHFERLWAESIFYFIHDCL